jgi:hypothetical protein
MERNTTGWLASAAVVKSLTLKKRKTNDAEIEDEKMCRKAAQNDRNW